MSLIDHTVESILNEACEKVGILASPTTINTRLYENKLRACGLRAVLPSKHQQGRTETLIRRTIAGNVPSRALLQHEIDQLRSHGAVQVILGCTELSVIAEEELAHAIDPLTIIVNKIFEQESDEQSII